MEKKYAGKKNSQKKSASFLKNAAVYTLEEEVYSAEEVARLSGQSRPRWINLAKKLVNVSKK